LLFRTFEAFYDWTQELPDDVTHYYFFAHNNARYDGRVLYNAHTHYTGIGPQVSWGGQRVLELFFKHPNQNTRISFRDSMFHINGALKNFASTFNLQEGEKGFFPYHLNQQVNEIFPDIPDIHHFEPAGMTEKAYQEFLQWYETKKGQPYNVDDELVKYCKQDVLILKWGLETYIQSALDEGSFNPLFKLTTALYCLATYQTRDYNPKKYPIYPTPKDMEEFIKKGFHGGRTDVRCRYYKPRLDEKILYIDIVSLYPTVQMFDPMPYEYPWWAKEAELHVDTLKDFFGFAEIDYEVLAYHFHPVNTFNVEIDGSKKLQADLLDHAHVVVESPKIQWMLDRPHQYRITKVHKILHYKKTNDMFTSYMNHALKEKCLNSMNLEGEDAIRQAEMYRDRSGGKLDFVQEVRHGKVFKKNPGRKLLAKLQCNNLWGKFGQRDMEEYCTVRRLNPHEFHMACQYEKEGTLRFVQPPIYQRNNGNAENDGQEYFLCAMDVEMKNAITARAGGDSQGDPPIRSIAVAAMVTAHAQLRLLKAMEVLDDRVLYHDTDSIVCVLPVNENLPPEIIIGECLGEWELEHPSGKERRITEFAAIGPKAYALKIEMENGSFNEIIKAKGCNITARRNAHVNFEEIALQAKGLKPETYVQSLNMTYKRREATMKSHIQGKIIRPTKLKGVQSGFRVLPHGYERFREGRLAFERYGT